MPSWAHSGLTQRCAALDSNCEHLICGGWWDGSVRMLSLGEGGQTVAFGHMHQAEVTAIALDSSDSLLVSGDAEGNCLVWKVTCKAGVQRIGDPVTLYPKHWGYVVATAVNFELNLIVTCGVGGICHVYAARGLMLTARLRPEFHPSWIQAVAQETLECTAESVCIGPLGTIAVHCSWTCPQAQKKWNSIHVYNINGRLLCSERTRSVNVLRISHCNEFLVGVGNKSMIIYRLAKYAFLLSCILTAAACLRSRLYTSSHTRTVWKFFARIAVC
jgi:WD40 repeat protein